MKHDIASSLILALSPEAGKLLGPPPLEFNMHAAGISDKRIRSDTISRLIQGRVV